MHIMTWTTHKTQKTHANAYILVSWSQNLKTAMVEKVKVRKVNNSNKQGADAIIKITIKLKCQMSKFGADIFQRRWKFLL